MSAAEDDRHGSYPAVLDGRVIGRASIEQKKFPTGLCNDNEQETILVTLRHKHDRLESGLQRKLIHQVVRHGNSLCI